MILIRNSSPTLDSTPTRDPVTSCINIAGGSILYHCQAGVEANNLPQSDPESAEWPWRDLISSSGSARVLVPIKTTPIIGSDFMGSDATETSSIPLRSWRRAPQPAAIGSRIGAVVVEGSVIELWDRQDSI